MPRVSVIIPVYRDWQSLQACLDALRTQTLATGEFEVLIVDNDESSPGPVPQLPNSLYIHAPEGFSYAARNAGIRQAKAPVLAFTDADCVPDPEWLEQGLQALRVESADILGGHIEMYSVEGSWAGRYDLCFGLDQEEFLRSFNAVTTANLFVKREVVECLEGFNAALQSGGDFDFCYRASAQGYRIGYSDLAKIKHHTRDSFDELIRKTRRIAGGVTDMSFSDISGKEILTTWRYWRAFVFPHLGDWWRTLSGRNGSKFVPFWQRPALMLLRVYFQYLLAWQILRVAGQSQRNKTVW